MPHPPYAAGPAFPTPFPNCQDGISVRDYFAAAAMTGMLAGKIKMGEGAIAALCYHQADAMIEARKALPAKPE